MCCPQWMIKGKYLKVYIVFVGSSDRQQPSGTQRHLVGGTFIKNTEEMTFTCTVQCTMLCLCSPLPPCDPKSHTVG